MANDNFPKYKEVKKLFDENFQHLEFVRIRQEVAERLNIPIEGVDELLYDYFLACLKFMTSQKLKEKSGVRLSQFIEIKLLPLYSNGSTRVYFRKNILKRINPNYDPNKKVKKVRRKKYY